jgi:small subunit ribosomal protein S6
MRKYEAMVIARPDLSDADVQKLADRYKAVIEDQGGKVESAGKWEKRKLAYEINKYKEGNYVLFHFEAEAKVPLELGRQLRINDDVIRHRIFRLDD